MKTILFILIGLVVHWTLFAQAPNTIRVKGGASGEKTVHFNDRYQYDRFRDGKIIYRDGASAMARFNYNVLLGEMQFINPSGDTLALANEPIVRLVSIGQDVFLYDQVKGYLQVIADYTVVKLAVKDGLKVAQNDKLGGYDQSSGTAAITNYQFYASGTTSVRKLDPKGDLVLIKEKTYFIVDQNNRTYPISKASLLKVFGKHRAQVTAYLTSESIDLKREDDLKKLLIYCSELL